MRFCIILGAAKSGTTSLFNYLAQHPEIVPCRNKEPNFFSLNYDKGDEEYFSLWDKNDVDTKVLLEATVNHSAQPTNFKSCENMLDFHKKHNPSMKFIYIMRNPIDRFESHHTYNYINRSKRTFEDSLKNKNTISASCYAEQLNLYVNAFGRENFLLLSFSELQSEPDQLLKKVCSFLSIDSDFSFQSTNTIHNKIKGVTDSSGWKTLTSKHPFIKKISEMLPKSLRSLIYKLVYRKKIPGRFRLTEKQRQQLYDILKDDMAELKEKYNIDVGKWGF